MAKGKVAGEAKILLTLDDQVQAGLRKIQDMLAGVGRTISSIGATAAAAGSAILAPLAGAATAFSTFGDQFEKMATRTGFSVQALTELAHAADTSGTSIEAVEKSIRGMERNILALSQGEQGAIDKFAELGLAMTDLQGLAPEDQFQLIADRIAAIEDPTRRAAVSMSIFGKAGSDLLPLLTGNMAALREEAKALGVTMSDEDAKAAAQLNDAMGRVATQMKAVAVNIGAAVAGPMTDFANWLRDHLSRLIEWVRNNGELVVLIGKIGATLAVAGTAVYGIGTAFNVAALAVGGLNVALTFLVAHPVIAGIAAITAGVVALAAAVRNANDAWNTFDESLEKSKFKQTMRSADELNQMIKRFEQLAAKASLNKDEIKETWDIVHALRMEYGKLAPRLTTEGGKISGADQFVAQLGAARGGRSHGVLTDRLSAAELSLDVARRKGADATEIASRVEQVAKLREELERYNRVVADATPTSTSAPAGIAPVASEPAVAKASGEKAGAAFGEAFTNFLRTKIEGVGDMITETLGDGSDWLANMGETIKQKLIEAQDQLKGPMIDPAKPQEALLDATFAGQIFSNRSTEVQILEKIEKNTQKPKFNGVVTAGD